MPCCPQARFNFPTAGYLADEQLRAVLAPLSTFPEVNDLIKRELLPPRPFPTQLRQTATADKARWQEARLGIQGRACTVHRPRRRGAAVRSNAPLPRPLLCPPAQAFLVTGMCSVLAMSRLGMQVQQAGVRSSRAAALQAGSVWVDLTAAKLRDCRVYLKRKMHAAHRPPTVDTCSRDAWLWLLGAFRPASAAAHLLSLALLLQLVARGSSPHVHKHSPAPASFFRPACS